MEDNRLPVYQDEPIQEPEPTGLFKFLGRLTGLWFVTVAAGSVLLSIPVSAIGLPIILSVGLTSLIVKSLFSWLYKLWIRILIIAWKSIRSLFTSPTLLIQYAGNMLKNTFKSLFSSAVDTHQPTLPIQTRRFSNAVGI